MDNIFFLIPIGFIIYIVLMMFIKMRLEWLAFLFILILPIQNIIPVGFTIGPRFSIRIEDAITLFLILIYLGRMKYFRISTIGQKNAVFAAILFLFWIIIYPEWKGHWFSLPYTFDIGFADIGFLMKRTLKFAILAFCEIIIIVELLKQKTQAVVDNAIICSVILLSASSFFTEQLAGLGFKVVEPIVRDGFVRQSGLSVANANEFSQMLTLCYGYFLSRLERGVENKSKYIIASVFAFLGVLATVSRTGFITFALISSIFFVRNVKRDTARITFIAIAVAVTFLFIRYAEPVLYRFGGTIERQSDLYTTDSRAAKWLIYLEDLSQNPHYFLAGNTDPPPIARDMHSLYISLLWRGGIILFLPFLLFLRRIYRQQKRKETLKYSLLYPMLGFLVPALTISGYMLAVHLPLIIAMASKDERLIVKDGNYG